MWGPRRRTPPQEQNTGAAELFALSFEEELGGTRPDCPASVTGPAAHSGAEHHSSVLVLQTAEPFLEVPGVWEVQPRVALDALPLAGEEEKADMFSQRAMLLRWRDGEWKETALGNAKLLLQTKKKQEK